MKGRDDKINGQPKLQGKLTTKSYLSYGCGDAGCCLINYMFSLYLSFYCTSVLGISLAVVGIIMLIVQMWDAVNDLIIGSLLDRANGNGGKAVPWIKKYAFLCCASAVLVFACPRSASMPVRILWIAISYFLHVLFYTCINLPYSTLMSLMSDDQDERMGLCVARYTGAYTGTLAVSLFALPLISMIGGTYKSTGYFVVMLLFGVISFLMFTLVSANCKERDSEIRSDKKTTGEKITRADMVKSLSVLGHNQYFIAVLSLCFIYWFRYPFYSSVMPYFYRFYLEIGEENSSVTYTAGIIAGILILPLVYAAKKRWGYRLPMIISCAISALSMAAGFFSKNSTALIIVFFSINYAAETFPCVMMMSMLADSLECNKNDAEKRFNGTGFALYNFLSKAGGGFGSLIVSLILQAGGLNPNAAGGQTEGALLCTRAVFWMVPALLSLVMIPMIRRCIPDKQCTM